LDENLLAPARNVALQDLTLRLFPRFTSRRSSWLVSHRQHRAPTPRMGKVSVLRRTPVEATRSILDLH